MNRSRLTALIVACALFMQNLDSTVITTALPAMARAFGADPVHMNVALTAYLLSLAVFIPASGWVADRFGARNVFRVAIAVFTLGSVLCGRSETLWFLVAARVLQGMGGAMMVPVGRLVLLRAVPKGELVAAMAWLTVPALVGPVVGPPLGGFLVTYASWRWIFDINVPIGLLGIVLVGLFVDDVPEPPPDAFDAWGLVFSGTAMAATMTGLETAGRGVVPLPVTFALLALGSCAAVAYVRHARRRLARRRLRPLLDLSLLRVSTFSVSVLAGSLFRVGVGAVPFLLPLMFQLGFDRSPLQSGLITFSSSAGALVMKPVASSVLRRFGFRGVLGWNGIGSALLLALLAAFRPAWPLVAVYGVLLAGGFLRSLQFTAFNSLAYADVEREQMSAATSLYSALQQISLTVGISAGAGTLQLAALVANHIRPTPSDYSVAFLVVAAVSLLAVPVSFSLSRQAGAELSGHA